MDTNVCFIYNQSLNLYNNYKSASLFMILACNLHLTLWCPRHEQQTVYLRSPYVKVIIPVCEGWQYYSYHGENPIWNAWTNTGEPWTS